MREADVKACVLLVFLATSSFGYPPALPGAELGRSIDSVIANVHGNFAIAFKDLRSGKSFYRNADRRFHAASTIKTAVMIEVFNQVRTGKFRLEDSLEVVNRFLSLVDGSPYSLDRASDSDDSLYSLLGLKVTIRKLVDDMITVSSNLAADLLINLVGPRNVRRTMVKMGAGEVRVIRGVQDTRAYELGRNNTVTARSLAVMFEQLALRRAVSRKASSTMLQILLEQKFNSMIPAQLPRDVKVAHKTGSSEGIQHDSGIVYLPDGRKYVLVVLSSDLYDARSGITSIAKISKIIYDYEAR